MASNTVTLLAIGLQRSFREYLTPHRRQKEENEGVPWTHSRSPFTPSEKFSTFITQIAIRLSVLEFALVIVYPSAQNLVPRAGIHQTSKPEQRTRQMSRLTRTITFVVATIQKYTNKLRTKFAQRKQETRSKLHASPSMESSGQVDIEIEI